MLEVPSGTRESAVELVNSTCKSLAWHAAESVSAGISPLGPVIVRSVYLGKQVVTIVNGMRNGEGFDLKLSIPGLSIPIEAEGAKLEVLARLHVGGSAPGGPTADTLFEIQFYEPPTGDGDVDSHQKLSGTAAPEGAPPAETVGESERHDPWAPWLDLVGKQLIQNLSWVLTYVASLPAGTVEASIRLGTTLERSTSDGRR